MLEQAEADTLLLLDCCAAASSTAATGNGVTELIAACGFETWAPEVGEHSFTRSLIEELKYLKHGPPFSVALLHNKVLSRIKYWKPRFSFPYAPERRKTPIYIQLANERNRRSIELCPLGLQNNDLSLGAISQSSTLSSSQPAESEDVEMSGGESSQSSLAEVWPDPTFTSPKVLISIALEENQRLRLADWNEWIRSIPALAKYMQVEGIYESDSLVITGLVPVAIWDMLPQDPAISFVCFIKSRNLCHLTRSWPPAVYEAAAQFMRTGRPKRSFPPLVYQAAASFLRIRQGNNWVNVVLERRRQRGHQGLERLSRSSEESKTSAAIPNVISSKKRTFSRKYDYVSSKKLINYESKFHEIF
ncbi:MAG: hypothetical protein Q9222_002007 [Ikaeria aurantiellina]